MEDGRPDRDKTRCHRRGSGADDPDEIQEEDENADDDSGAPDESETPVEEGEGEEEGFDEGSAGSQAGMTRVCKSALLLFP